MKDRVPTYPGRVRLTPVSGEIYDMTLADEPTVPGTPLDKAHLLTDETAAAMGMDPTDDPSVNDAFARLQTAKQEQGQQYSATFSVNGWTLADGYYTQTVTVQGLEETYAVAPIVDVTLSGTDAATDAALIEGFAFISLVKTGTNTLTAMCAQGSPTVNVPVTVIVFK